MRTLCLVRASVATLAVLGARVYADGATYYWPVNGHYYTVTNTNVGWTAANQAATQAGGYLATITSPAENAFVLSISGAAGQNKWVGGFQPLGTHAPNQDWQWVTGEPFTFTNWQAGEPNDNNGEEDRLMIDSSNLARYGGGHWNDLSGSELATGYVIENTSRQPTSTPVRTGSPVSSFPVQFNGAAKNLVIGLHGFTPTGRLEPDAPMPSLGAAIQQQLNNTGRSADWTVIFPDWTSAGSQGTNLLVPSPAAAVSNAELYGNHVAQTIIDAGFTTVHIIGHSAGAWAVDGLGRALAAHGGINVYETYLDPYAPSGSPLGAGARFAENYYTENGLPFTRAVLPNATNYAIDDLKVLSGDGDDDHGFPVRWYTATVNPTYPYSNGLGYGLSPEATGRSSPLTNAPSKMQIETRPATIAMAGSTNESPLDFEQLVPNASGGSGTIKGASSGITAASSSFVWETLPFETSQAFNEAFISYSFSSVSSAVLGLWIDGQPVYLAQGGVIGITSFSDAIEFAQELQAGTHYLGVSLESLDASNATVTVSQFSLSSVPEPGSISLVILASFCLVRRRANWRAASSCRRTAGYNEDR